MRRRAIQRMRSLLFVILCSYLGTGLLGYMVSDAMIFLPPRASYLASDVLLLPGPTGNVAAIYLPNPEARYTVLYSHGNAEDIGLVRPVLELIRQQGFAVLAYDYPGYGHSAGSPSESSVYSAISTAYSYLTTELAVPADRIIVHGRSLGGGAAVELASREPVAGLVLESAFVSAFRVMTRISLYPVDKFRNADKIQQVRAPVLVIHGREDEVIAFWHGQHLFNLANEPKQSKWIDGGGHNNLIRVAGDQYAQSLRDFASFVETTQLHQSPSTNGK